MKQVFPLLLMLCCNISFGQTAEKILKNVNSGYDADTLMKENPRLQGEFININSLSDTAFWQKQLYTKKKDDIVIVGKRAYRILSDTTAIFSKVSYIYLDGSALSLGQIDTMRQYIISEYDKGVSFAMLAREFSIDGGKENGGELNWFMGGNMMPEFTDAVNKHRLSDVFTVDIPGNKWYYVVKKTFESKEGVQVSAFSINSNTSTD